MNINRKPLFEANAEYSKWLENKGRKRNTVKNHQSPMSALTKVVGNIQVHRITIGDIEKVFEVNDWKPATRNVYATSFKGFFSWCARRSYINPLLDPTIELEAVRVPKVKKTYIDPEDFPRLLEVAGEFHPRDRACIALGLFTFCRASEIRNLQIQDIDFSGNIVNIYRIKTEQYDELPLSMELSYELRTWFAKYREMTGGRFNPHWYVIPRFGPMPMIKNPLTNRLAPNPALLMPLIPDEKTNQIYRPVKRAMETLGYETRGQGMHSLRRSGSRAAFKGLREDGYDRAIGRVSAMLGHASVKTTEIYTGVELDKIERNETWAGKPMFPSLFNKPGLEVIDGGEDRAVGL